MFRLQGSETPEAPPRDDAAGVPAHAEHRHNLQRPSAADRRERRGSPGSLAVEEDISPGETTADDVRPLRVRPAGRAWFGVRDVESLEHRKRAVEVAPAPHPPRVVDAAFDAQLPRRGRGAEQRRDEVLRQLFQ